MSSFRPRKGSRQKWQLALRAGLTAFLLASFLLPLPGAPGGPIPRIARADLLVDDQFNDANWDNWVGATGGVQSMNGSYLYLTSALVNQSGGALYNVAVDSSDGLIVEFRYQSGGGSGGNGMSFFLVNGSTTSFSLGNLGSSLGYSDNNTNPDSAGLDGGWLGVGLDEYGGYGSTTWEDDGPWAGANPGIGLRGSEGKGYPWMTGLRETDMANYSVDMGWRRVKVTLYPTTGANANQFKVEWDPGDDGNYNYTPVNIDLSNGTYAPKLDTRPAAFKFGFAASTGAATNNHLIDWVTANTVVNDATPPTVTSITPNLSTIGEGNVGAGAFYFDIAFDDTMNTTVAPTVTFPTEDPSSTLSGATGSWTNFTTYRVTYNVADTDQSLAAIDVRVSGAKDGSNNTMVAQTVADVFSIDTTAPGAATMTAPASGSTSTSATMPASLSGTAADNSGGQGLNANTTTFALRRSSDSKYWDGDSWETAATWLATTHGATTGSNTGSWTSNATLPSWSRDTYSVQTRATDKAGNIYTGSAVTYNVTVNTTTTLASSAASAVPGQTVTFTATVSSSEGTPTGSVTFKDGTATLGTGTLSGGTTTFTTSSLAAGSHSITAEYGGDTTFLASTSAALAQGVSTAATSTTLTSSPNPSTFGQTVAFTATVTSASGTPAGTVTFKDGSTSVGAVNLSSGAASLSTSSLAVGSHSVTAEYGGSSTHASSTSSALAQTVNKAAPSVTLTASSFAVGQTGAFTATVTSGAGTPTGPVTFLDGTTTLGTGTLSGGTASFSTSSLGGGAHSITARYDGDGSFSGAVSSALALTVGKVTPAVALTSWPNPSSPNATVVFTATVSSAAGTPTGSVTFKDGTATLGTGTLSGGTTTFTTSSLAAGSHSITAQYGGDGNFNSAVSSAYSQTVASPVTGGWSAMGSGLDGKVTAPTVDTSGNVYAAKGSTIEKTDTTWGVIGFGCKDWVRGPCWDNYGWKTTKTYEYKYSVFRWRDGAWTQLGGEFDGEVKALAVDRSGNLYAGGDFTNAGGTAANRIAVWNGSSWSALGSGTNRMVHTLAVDRSGNLYAGGEFRQAGGTAANRIAVWNGSSWSALGKGTKETVYTLAVDGSGNLYAGGRFTKAGDVDGKYVAKWDGSSWSALSSGTNGRVYTLAVAGGNLYAGGRFTKAGGVDTKNVARWDGSGWSALGTGMNDEVIALAVDGSNLYAGGEFTKAGGADAKNVATWDGSSWSALGSGTNGRVTALAVNASGSLYAGGSFIRAGDVDANHVAVYRQAAGSATVLTSSLNPSSFGQSVTLTATVTSGGASPTGVVIFKESSTVLGTGTLSGGTAALGLSNLWVGSHTVTAQYAGSDGYKGSVSAPVTQTVQAAPAALAVASSLRATSGPNPPKVGITTTYELVLKASNPSSQAIGNVVVVDTLSSPFNILATRATAGTISPSGQNVTWNAGTLSAGGTATAVVTVAAAPGEAQSGQTLPVDTGASASGAPSAGASVTASAAALSTGVVTSPTGGISGAVTSAAGAALGSVAVSVYKSGNLLAARATTGPNGQYSVSSLPVGTYTVKFDLAGYLPGSDHGTVAAGQTLRLDGVLTRRAGSVSGTVSDSATGAGIPSAMVELTDASGATLATTAAGPKGEFAFGEVPSGASLTVAASHPDYVASSSSSASVQPDVGAVGVRLSPADRRLARLRGSGVELKLAPLPGSLSGAVTDSASELAVSGATVWVEDAQGNQVAIAQAGTDGSFSVPSLAQGTYTVYFSHRAYQPASAPAAMLPNGRLVLDAALAPITGSIAGTVLDCGSSANGSASSGIAGAAVNLMDSTGRTWDATSDDAGQFQFQDVVPGTYTLSASAPYYKAGAGNPASTTVGGTVNVGWVMQIAGLRGSASPQLCLEKNLASVSGTASDALTGAGLPGAAVQLYDRIDNLVGRAKASTDGGFTLSDLPAGIYSLSFSQPNYRDATQLFMLRAGEASTYNGLLSPRPGSIAGVVKGSASLMPLRDASVSLLDSADAVVATATTDNTGHYVLSGVLPGQYTVAASRPGYVEGQKGSASVSMVPLGTAQADLYLDPSPSTLSGLATSAATGQPVAVARAMAYDGSGNLIATTTTDATGVYTLTNLVEGKYTLTMDGSASGYLLATASVDLGPGRTQSQNMALAPRAGSLSGRVTNALSGSPLAATEVVLSYGDGTTAAARTNGNGEYAFTGVTTQVVITATASASPPFYGQNAASTGTGTIPAGGASTVNLRLQPSPGSVSGQASSPLGPVSGGTIQVSDALGNVVAQGTTDAAGAFSIAAVAPGTYTLTFGKPGYLASSYSATVSPGSVTRLTMAVTPLAGSISGVVKVSSTLQTVAGATVNLADSSGNILSTTRSDASGRYTFSGVTPGSYQVAAVHSDYQSGAAAGATGTLAANGSLEINLLLAPRAATITGRASNATTGQPIAGATVRVYRGSLDLLATATTDTTGAYSVSNVPESSDPYTLEWSAAGFMPASSKARISSGQRAVQNMGLVPLDGSLSGRVTDFVTGRAIVGALVEVRGSSGDILASGRTDGAGRYLFVGLPPQASLSITAAAPNYRNIAASSATLDFTSSSSRSAAGRRVSALTATADLQVEANPGSIAGKATDAQTGAPLPGATVQLYDTNNNLVASTTADATGNYTFPEVTVGTYTVSVATSGYLPQTQSLNIDAGQASSQDLPLPAQANSISGAVTDAATGAPLVGATVVLTDTSGLAASAVSRSGGFYAFAGASAGTFRLSAGHPDYNQGSGSATNLIVLSGQPGAANLSLNPKTGNLSGTVLGAAGQPVAGAAVRLQDGSGNVLGTYTAGDQGIYAFYNLDPGQYSLSASKSGFLDGSSTAGINPNQSLSLDIPLTSLAQSIAGTVSDSATGQAIAGGSVSLTDAGGNIYISLTGPTGHYAFGSLTPGAYTLRASHPDYDASSGSSTSATLASGGAVSRDLRLDPRKGSIQAIVEDNSTGLALPGATVTITSTQGVVASLNTDSQGQATSGALAAGQYTVTSSVSGRASRSATATVVSNRKTVAMLYMGYTIRVTVLESASGRPVAGAMVVASKSGATAASGVTDASGSLLLDLTNTGDFTVSVTAPEHQQTAGSSSAVSISTASPSPSANLTLSARQAPHVVAAIVRHGPPVSTQSAGDLWSELYYTVAYANRGTGPATGVLITDTIPAGTSFTGPSSWTRVADRTYVNNVGSLAAGVSGTVEIAVRKDLDFYSATYVNIASASEDGQNGLDLRPADAVTDVLTIYRSLFPVIAHGVLQSGW